MTLVLSLIHPNAIIMASDSRKIEHSTRIDFHTSKPIEETKVQASETNKLFLVSGVGCVTMWGDITRVKIGSYIRSITNQLKGPDHLAEKIFDYLREEVSPENDGDLGFHIGGFKPDGTKALFHVFFGSDIGPDVDPRSNPRKLKKYDHSNTLAVYNGKHELADTIIKFLLALQQEVGLVSWITSYPPEKVAEFAKFIIKQVAKVDPMVGGTVKVATILPENRIKTMDEQITHSLPVMGILESQEGNYSRPTGTFSYDEAGTLAWKL